MVLSDGELWAALGDGSLYLRPEPTIADQVQPSSIDLHLRRDLLVQRSGTVSGVEIDPQSVDVMDHLNAYCNPWDLIDQGTYTMAPSTFVIGRVHQHVKLSNQYAARVEGRSKIARLGLVVHMTAPKIDPGYGGHITLEMFNYGPFTLKLSDKMKISCLIVERLGEPAKQTYSGGFNEPTECNDCKEY